MLDPNGTAEVFNPISVQGGIAILTPYILETLKNARWFPWVNDFQLWRVRLLSMVTALATSVGISFSYDASIGQLVVTGLTFGAVLQLLFQAAVQFKVQETVYRAAIKPHQDPR